MNPFLAHDIRESPLLRFQALIPLSQLHIPSALPNRLRLAIERYALLTGDQAANSGFIPSRVKQWIGMVRDISDKVPRDVIAAVKHARTTTELLERIEKN